MKIKASRSGKYYFQSWYIIGDSYEFIGRFETFNEMFKGIRDWKDKRSPKATATVEYLDNYEPKKFFN
jgi:hypothetical protein